MATKTNTPSPSEPAAATDVPKAAAPTMVSMPRAVHELVTGPEPDAKIDAGTLITDDVAEEHGLEIEQLAALVASGAIELVDVLKG